MLFIFIWAAVSFGRSVFGNGPGFVSIPLLVRNNDKSVLLSMLRSFQWPLEFMLMGFSGGLRIFR